MPGHGAFQAGANGSRIDQSQQLKREHRVDGDRIHGRGSCDAKGLLVSQLAAAEVIGQRPLQQLG